MKIPEQLSNGDYSAKRLENLRSALVANLDRTQLLALLEKPDAFTEQVLQVSGMNLKPEEKAEVYEISYQITHNLFQAPRSTDHEELGRELTAMIIEKRELSPVVKKAALAILTFLLSLSLFMTEDTSVQAAGSATITSTSTPIPEKTATGTPSTEVVALPTTTPTATRTATPKPTATATAEATKIPEVIEEEVANKFVVAAISVHPYSGPHLQTDRLEDVAATRGMELTIVQERGEFVLVKIEDKHYWFHLPELLVEPSLEDIVAEKLPVFVTVTIKNDNTNIRELPTTQSDVVHVATKNEEYRVVDEYTDENQEVRKEYIDAAGFVWYKITISSPNQNKIGYVRSDLVEYAESKPTLMDEDAIGGSTDAVPTPEASSSAEYELLLSEVAEQITISFGTESELEQKYQVADIGEETLLRWMVEAFAQSEVLSEEMGSTPTEVLQYLKDNQGNLPKSFRQANQLPPLAAGQPAFHDRVQFDEIKLDDPSGRVNINDIKLRVIWNNELKNAGLEINNLLWSGNEPGYVGCNVLVDSKGQLTVVAVLLKRDVYENPVTLKNAIHRGIWMAASLHRRFDGNIWSEGDNWAFIEVFKQSTSMHSSFAEYYVLEQNETE